jgi:hypothetical protein
MVGFFSESKHVEKKSVFRPDLTLPAPLVDSIELCATPRLIHMDFWVVFNVIRFFR